MIQYKIIIRTRVDNKTCKLRNACSLHSLTCGRHAKVYVYNRKRKGADVAWRGVHGKRYLNDPCIVYAGVDVATCHVSFLS